MTIEEALRSAIKSGKTPEKATDYVLSKARKVDLATFVRPVVLMRARNYLRGETRAIEQEVDHRIADGEDPISVRRKLAQSSFALPDGTYVDWLDATAEQHRARAGWSRHQSSSLVADAERHEAAASAITTAGVSCLRDLEEAA